LRWVQDWRWIVNGGLRYFAGAVAFGFAALWIMASLAAALVCLLAAIAGYGVVVAVERVQARRPNRRGSSHIAAPRTAAMPSGTPEMPLWADALNSDLGHIYEPSMTTSPLSREAEYGWPQDDHTVSTSETLH
jgi:hypothetical protein